MTLPQTIHFASNFLVPSPCPSTSHFVPLFRVSFYLLDGLLPDSELPRKADMIFKARSVAFCCLTAFNEDSLVAALLQPLPLPPASCRGLRATWPAQPGGPSAVTALARFCRLHPRGKASSTFSQPRLHTSVLSVR